jgi:23S rRNA (adenine1618-N6)-methyltransferase
MDKVGKEKSSFHERNRHRDPYNFEDLVKANPELSTHVSLNKYGNQSIDFANPAAVKALNKSLLLSFYGIKYWDIPDGYLCPPIPGRADYLHYAADLLASSHHGTIPKGKKIKVLDVGVGANCIYPIIGHHEYGWRFVGSEVDELAVRTANHIIEINPSLKDNVEIRKQTSTHLIFKGIMRNTEKFDLTICNPPFHSSAAEAMAGTQRKTRNLGKNIGSKPVLNFGGVATELWTAGGEMGFIERMIDESKQFAKQCLWFTSLISKSENLPGINAKLHRIGAVDMRMSEMATGNKISRIIAWTFLTEEEQGK